MTIASINRLHDCIKVQRSFPWVLKTTTLAILYFKRHSDNFCTLLLQCIIPSDSIILMSKYFVRAKKKKNYMELQALSREMSNNDMTQHNTGIFHVGRSHFLTGTVERGRKLEPSDSIGRYHIYFSMNLCWNKALTYMYTGVNDPNYVLPYTFQGKK